MMQHGTSMHVVVFGSVTEYLNFNDALDALDYSVTHQDGECWLASTVNHASDPIILFLGANNFPCDQLCLCIDHLYEARVFAVLSPKYSSWNYRVLDRCHDVLVWPCRPDELQYRLERMSETYTVQSAGVSVPADLRDQFTRMNLVGESPRFLATLNTIKTISECDETAIISGETGTGKELAARAIHYLGSRNGQPFVPVNCGAIPDELFENELFGHERGAYTDARGLQQGLVEQANGGTIFLDEIDSLSDKAQVVLLRFLQDQKYKPLGSSQSKQTDLRIISASNADLQDLVHQSRFRQDLFYRLNILSLSLPPLRERVGDISILANHFLERYRHQYHKPERFLHAGARRWLEQYHWPGNIRELENTLLRAFLMSKEETVKLPQAVIGSTRKGLDNHTNQKLDSCFREAKALTIAKFEYEYLVQLMDKAKGNVTHAAMIAGKERRSLGKLLKKHGLEYLRLQDKP